MTRIAFALPAELDDRLATDAERNGHEVVARCATAHELAARIESVRPHIALVAADQRHLTERLVAVCDDAGVRVVAIADSEERRRYAASMGLDETIDRDADWTTVEAAFDVIPRERLTTPQRDERDERDDSAEGEPRGRVVTVWGPAGAPGRSTVAIGIAAELAAAGRSVALADVDTYSGTIAPSLGMLDESPGFAAACRLASTSSLTRTELERIGQRYVSAHGSFWVLAGIGRPSRWPELSAQRVTATLNECRSWVDFVVVDTSFSLENDEEIRSDLFAPRRNAATITALREADTIVAVGASDAVGLSRFLRAHVDLIELSATARIVVAMNKMRASAIGLNPGSQVTQTLGRFGGIEPAALIPFDQQAMDAASLSARTLVDAAPKSSVRIAIRDLVAAELVPARPGRRRRGLLPRPLR